MSDYPDPNAPLPTEPPVAAAAEGWGEVPPSPPAGTRVAFCQDCGKPLTAETLRAVGPGVFCEPCLAARIAAQNGVPFAGFPATPLPGRANPMLAGLLGLIPGVGAMYNGQYAKGFAHLIIFVLLDSISKNGSSVFGLVVFGWVIYQVFDAYHTAKARNEGLPLPNVFGLNDIGEKVGFGRTWGTHSPASAPPVPPVPPDAAWQAAAPPPSAAAYPGSPTPGTPASSGPDWVGYVPPTHFASAAASTPPAYRDAGQAQPPYAQPMPPMETFTGTGVPNPYAVPPVPPPFVPVAYVPRRRFPVGAFWLIGLGVLILVANLIPDWRITEAWWPVLVFAGLSVTIFVRRLHSRSNWIAILRVPVIFMLLAVIFAVHALNVYVNFGILCAILFITLGALLVLERTIGAFSSDTADAGARASFVPAPDAVAPAASPEDHDPKGGL